MSEAVPPDKSPLETTESVEAQPAPSADSSAVPAPPQENQATAPAEEADTGGLPAHQGQDDPAHDALATLDSGTTQEASVDQPTEAIHATDSTAGHSQINAAIEEGPEQNAVSASSQADGFVEPETTTAMVAEADAAAQAEESQQEIEPEASPRPIEASAHESAEHEATPEQAAEHNVHPGENAEPHNAPESAPTPEAAHDHDDHEHHLESHAEETDGDHDDLHENQAAGGRRRKQPGSAVDPQKLAEAKARALERLLQEANRKTSSVTNLISLLEEGSTVPFIARYRKERTGGMDEVVISDLKDRYEGLVDIELRKQTILATVSRLGKLTPELDMLIRGTFNRVDLEDLYLPYRPKRKSKATTARERGLEPLAAAILKTRGEGGSLREFATGYVDRDKNVNSIEQALVGAGHIIAEWISDDPNNRRFVREQFRESGRLVAQAARGKQAERSKYESFYNFSEPVKDVPVHRFLAIRRGNKEQFLNISLELERLPVLRHLNEKYVSAPFPMPTAETTEASDQTTPISLSDDEADHHSADEHAETEHEAVSSEELAPAAEAPVETTPEPETHPQVAESHQQGDGEGPIETSEATANVEEADAGQTTEAAEHQAEPDHQSEVTAAEPEATAQTEPVSEPDGGSSAESHVEQSEQLEATTETRATVSEESQPVIEAAATETVTETTDQAPSAEAQPEPEFAANEASLRTAPRKPAALQQAGHQFDTTDFLRLVIADAYDRLLFPAVASEVRTELVRQSDAEAIEVFAKNLRELLLAPPAGSIRVMGIDPGFRTGCKVAVITETGKFIFNGTIYPHPPQKQWEEAKNELRAWVGQYQVTAIAIGNGTASRETLQLAREIARETEGLRVVLVNEAGASVYSASRQAREEFPDIDLTVRGAIDIARRLQDPLAELVKIEPRSIGVGQYQHDVDQGRLKRSLKSVVESSVNYVGVDLNTASVALLSYVSGLGPSLAREIVGYRNNLDRFNDRQELNNIPRFGAKTFEQAAGFLRIRDGRNPLDNTAVHPESYGVVEAMAAKLNVGAAELVGNPELLNQIRLQDFATEQVGMPTLRDIIDELRKPGRDPRETFETVDFREDVRDLNDLTVGMELEGIVSNITNFGAFVDIGVHQDGLVHISHLSRKFIKDPHEAVHVGQRVKVKVIEVDKERRRIGLSVKDALPAEPPRPRAPRPQRRPQPSAAGQGAPETRVEGAPGDGRREGGGQGRPQGDRRGPRPDQRRAPREDRPAQESRPGDGRTQNPEHRRPDRRDRYERRPEEVRERAAAQGSQRPQGDRPAQENRPPRNEPRPNRQPTVDELIHAWTSKKIK